MISKENEREQERSFAILLMMQHLVVPTFVLDTQCQVVIWNIACERLTGIPASEIIGTSDHWRGFFASPRPCLSDLIVRELTREVHDLYALHAHISRVRNGLYAEKWCVMPQVGTRLYLAIDANPIYDNTGKLIAVVETVRDITIQKEAQRALQELANKDGLTGIANRRRFDETLQTEWRRAMRKSQTLTLLMIDVDHFKNYNDSYGHQAGDECLKRIAKAMADTPLRAGDLVARYGGEEFVVILTGVSLDGATTAAERIRFSIEQLGMPRTNSASEVVTVSIGAATATALPTSNPAQLIAAADLSLYQAKHAGRNRVVAVNADTVHRAQQSNELS